MPSRQARSRKRGMFRWILEIKENKVIGVCYRGVAGEGIKLGLGNRFRMKKDLFSIQNSTFSDPFLNSK